MSVLGRKLAREIRRSAGILATVVAIIAVGTGSLIGMLSAQRILVDSQRAYYEHYQFADFWIDVKKVPLDVVQQIERMPGIASVETRISFDVILDLPRSVRPVSGRLLSVPAAGYDAMINGICLVRGFGFSAQGIGIPAGRPEVILGDQFARAHELEPGDRIHLILNRKRESFVIVGTAISPEYVYMVRGQGDFVPDPEHFGILYVREDYARDVLGFRDSCNQIVGLFAAESAPDSELLLKKIDRRLEPYGVLATTPRSRQASHRFLSDEIAGLGISATVMPAIFLIVAALVLNLLMGRLAERQRTVIGTLKALGYSSRQVFGHYLLFGVAVGAAGGLAGAVLGVSLAAVMIKMYREFFQFPTFLHHVYPDLLLLGAAFSLIFAVAGAAKGVWIVLKLEPAEAMRPRPPQRGGAIVLERFPFLWKALSFRSHLALRGLFRNPGRTLIGIISSALATSIMLMALMMYDSMLYLIDFQFERVAHSDVDIGMRDEQSVAALRESRDLPGVDSAEPILGITCDVRFGRNGRRLSIVGLSAQRRMTTPVDSFGDPVDIPPRGLVMSHKLARILGVEVGDRLELTPVRGRRETLTAPLAAIIESYLGLECYADLDYLSRTVGESRALNSVQLRVDPARQASLYATLKQLPNAQGLSVRADTQRSIESTLIETSVFSLGVLIVFAGVIAFGSMLNASVLEIEDRRRDIATFRVLGYRPRQITGIFLRQNLLVFALGLLASLPLGYGMVQGMATAYDTELFRMPVIVRGSTIARTGLLAVAFVAAAQWFVHRRICRLDWLEDVKTKE